MIAVHAGIPLVAFLAYGALIYVLQRSGITPGPRRVLCAFLAANCLAAFFSFTLHTNLLHNPEASMWGLAAAGSFIYATMLHFAAVFPYRKGRTRAIVVGTYSLAPIVVGLAFASRRGILDVQYLADGVVHIHFGPVASLVFLFMAVAGALAMTLLAVSLKHERDQLERRRIKYTLAASTMLVVGVLMNTIPPFSGYPVDTLFQLTSAGLLSYAILRHRLLGMVVLTREKATNTLAFLSALLAYLGIILLLAFVPQSTNRVLLAACGAAAAITISWVYYRFGDALNRTLRARILHIHYDPAQLTEDAGRLLTQPKQPKVLKERMLLLLTESLRVEKASLWLAQRGSDTYALDVSVGTDGVRRTNAVLRNRHPIVMRLKRSKGVLGPLQMQELHTTLTSTAVDTTPLDMADATVALALYGAEGMIGFLMLGPKRDGFYLHEDLRTLDAFRNQAGVALDNLRFQERLRALTSQLSVAEERERRRIASAVHDQVAQSLAVIKMKLGELRRVDTSATLVDRIQTIREMVDQAMEDTRSVTYALSPPVLYELGLEAALEWLAEQVERNHSIACHFEHDGQTKPLGDDARGFLFWAARELMMNVVKHANASIARLSLSGNDGMLCLRVQDDGEGFYPTEMERRTSGFGLFSIRERLTDFGGHFQLDSRPGLGTTVTIVLPLDRGNASAKLL
ncbi:MAG: histidine kinase [Chloroflexota bacterium]|nr:histidine kinase [Chloroflexota bacterium]